VSYETAVSWVHFYTLKHLLHLIWKEYPVEYFTFFEPCIVKYLYNKKQHYAHFFINVLIYLYCPRHVSNTQVFILRKTCTWSFMVFLSCIRISSLVDGRTCTPCHRPVCILFGLMTYLWKIYIYIYIPSSFKACNLQHYFSRLKYLLQILKIRSHAIRVSY
jgi:hypothetical protein